MTECIGQKTGAGSENGDRVRFGFRRQDGCGSPYWPVAGLTPETITCAIIAF